MQQGDTVSAIAQALGLSIAALLAENQGLDPSRLFAGQLLQLPAGARYDPRYDRGYRYDPRYDDDYDYDDDDDYDDDRKRARVSLKPDEGRRGQTIDVRLRGLNRNERVTLGFQQQNGRFEPHSMMQADRKGRLDTKLRVPDWANPRRDLYVVAERPNGRMVRSEAFDVRGQRADRGDGDRRRGDRIEGWIVRGVECPVLRTPGGRSYSLVSDNVRLPLGAYVELRGRQVGSSFCQEGAGTIQVSRLREIDPPN